MKIRILEKCKIGAVSLNPGDVIDVPQGEALNLEAHGQAEFAPEAWNPQEDEEGREAETHEKKHAEHKGQAPKKSRSHNG